MRSCGFSPPLHLRPSKRPRLPADPSWTLGLPGRMNGMGALGFLRQGVTGRAAGSVVMVALSQWRWTCSGEVTVRPGIPCPKPPAFNWRHVMCSCQRRGSRCGAGLSPGWCGRGAAVPSLCLNYSPGVLWQACSCPGQTNTDTREN